MLDGESFEAHAAFVTTASAAEPNVSAAVGGRELRCKITRTVPGHNALAGRYFVTLLEDEWIAADDSGPSIGTPNDAGGIVNAIKISPFIWEINCYTVTVGVITLNDLVGSHVSMTWNRVDPM